MDWRCHHTIDAAWFQSGRASVLKHGRQARLQAPFFPRSCGGAAGADGSAIDPPLFPIELPKVVKGGAQGDQHAGEAPLLTPATIAVIDRAPGAITLGNVAPGCAGVQLPEQTIENTAMLSPGMASFRAGMWKIGFEQAKLLISQFVSSHQNTSKCTSDADVQHILGHR
jgi:hypothetical protein